MGGGKGELQGLDLVYSPYSSCATHGTVPKKVWVVGFLGEGSGGGVGGRRFHKGRASRCKWLARREGLGDQGTSGN